MLYAHNSVKLSSADNLPSLFWPPQKQPVQNAPPCLSVCSPWIALPGQPCTLLPFLFEQNHCLPTSQLRNLRGIFFFLLSALPVNIQHVIRPCWFSVWIFICEGHLELKYNLPHSWMNGAVFCPISCFLILPGRFTFLLPPQQSSYKASCDWVFSPWKESFSDFS